jgi:hypothetical protein
MPNQPIACVADRAEADQVGGRAHLIADAAPIAPQEPISFNDSLDDLFEAG